MKLPAHLRFLEAEAIHIFREVAATTSRPVMLYSVGKDSSVLTRLAFKAFHPMRPPFPFLHVDTTWKFRELIEFRDRAAAELQFDLVVHINQEGLQEQINPFIHGASHHIHVWKTIGLKQAIRQHKFDAALGGARRDEEKSRAKERIFSIRNSEQNWDPKNQRPELWKTYNTLLMPDESLRVFPLSNWTELDVWQYIQFENIPVVPLYFAAKRLVVEINGFLILVDDERMPLELRYKAKERIVRFRSLGCYPLTGAISSHAQTVEEIIRELRDTRSSERHVRTMDFDKADTLERKKREGYF